MSGGLEVTLPWGDSEQTFKITIGGWRRIQDKCDAGPDEIASRLSPTVIAMRNSLPIGDAALRGIIGRWRIDDVREVIYQGLLGSGTSPLATSKLMAELVDERPIRQNVPLAFAIVMASLQGVPDDSLGEPKGEGTATAPNSPEERSPTAPSTAEADALVSRRRKSTR